MRACLHAPSVSTPILSVFTRGAGVTQPLHLRGALDVYNAFYVFFSGIPGRHSVFDSLIHIIYTYMYIEFWARRPAHVHSPRWDMACSGMIAKRRYGKGNEGKLLAAMLKKWRKGRQKHCCCSSTQSRRSGRQQQHIQPEDDCVIS